MRGKKVPRDDPSDVFSLGCVFLEMATLILGKSLQKFSEHYTTQKNETGIEDAYHCNLDRVHTWIGFLQRSNQLEQQHEHQPEQQSEQSLVKAQIESHDFVPEVPDSSGPEKGMVDALNAIRQMLDETPIVRPKARGLWQKFHLVSSEICRDCDPRHPEVWKPSEVQRQKAEEGTNSRRSMHLIPEELANGLYTEDGQFKFSGIDSSLLSAQDGRYNQRQRRSSSPHIHKRSGASLSVINSSVNGVPPSLTASTKRASSPDTRPHMNHRSSITISPRPASPTMSAKPGLTKTSSHPRAASPPSTGLPSDHRNQSGILNKTSSTTQLPNLNKRGSVSYVPSSPRASRTTLKTSSGDLVERQAQKATQNGAVRPEEDKLPPMTDVMIYDFSGELLYVAAYASLNGTLVFASFLSSTRAHDIIHYPMRCQEWVHQLC